MGVQRIGVFAPRSKPNFSRLVTKKWKDAQISVEKKAALDTADATPAYSPSQRPVQAVSWHVKPPLDLRRLLSYRICHLPLFS
jgi:hypothetical protein